MLPNKIKLSIKSALTVMALLTVGLFSCNKNDISIKAGIYDNGPQPLVTFKGVRPMPEEGKIGSEVTFAVKGLNGKDHFDFYIAQVKAKVLSVTDSTITVKVPENASSGGASVVIDGQTYSGPIFQVEGKVSIDPNWKATTGANREIMQITDVKHGNFIINGLFTDYNGEKDSKPVNHIAVISSVGEYVDQLDAGKGANGAINTFTVLNTENVDYQNKFIVGGSFGTYNVRSHIQNITMLNGNASLDSMIVTLINPSPDNKNPNSFEADTVPAFNGGVTGGRFPSVIKTFFDSVENEIIVVGNYTTYNTTYYPRSTRGGFKTDRSQSTQIMKMHLDGSRDSTFNYDTVTEKSSELGNGFILDAIRLPGGKLVVVGNFTNLQGVTANHIALIDDQTGMVDPGFGVGSGADGAITRITYNKTTGKMLITGSFKNFDGQPANGVVMLNTDGSVDPNFSFGTTTDGRANYAGQLDNGLILVSGRFTHYNDIVRPGFMILNPDGTLADGYNNTGAFIGQINQIIESPTLFGTPGVIIVGDFSRFDNVKVGNIIKIEIKK